MALKVKTRLKCWYLLKRNFVLITWAVLLSYVSIHTFEYYRTEKKFAHLQNILGVGLYTSRATATVLNICGALVLFPVCKKLNQLVHIALSKVSNRLLVYWLSEAQSCHIMTATTLMVFAVIHTVAHVVNAWNFCRYYDAEHEDINWAEYPNQNPLHLLFFTRTGLTGMSLLLILFALAVSSMRPIRNRSYNIFWYTHHLFLPFMILLLLHPLSGVLKEQINVCEEEDSMQRFKFNLSAGQFKENFRQEVRAIFLPIRSQTWMWISFPLFCYIIDSIYRKLQRNFMSVNVVEAELFKGGAIHLRLNYFTNSFLCKPGQYILLQWPKISNIEWHPFTVCQISSNDEASLSLLINITGDWTKKLEDGLKYHMSSELSSKTEQDRLRMLIDGPYSSPMENIIQCHVAVCIAAGAGITPFAAVLDSLLRKPQSLTPHRLHLVWICRTDAQIMWFAELLSEVYKVLWSQNQPDRLHLQLHVTRPSWEMSDEFSKSYPLLSCRLRKGRPDWNAVFDYLTYLYPRRQTLSVFCCGPNKLIKTMKKYCRIFSGCSTTKIDFYHEAFS